MNYYDMHCHLDFASNTYEAAAKIDALGVGALAVSVLPDKEQEKDACTYGMAPLVRWGVGLHPWWITDGRVGAGELEILLSLIPRNRFVGEIGLDFGKTHGGTARTQKAQLRTFERVAQACAQKGDRVLSIHAVAAAPEAFEILRKTHTLDTCTCIFHWYSGDGETFHQAVQAGCYFSVGSFMLETKRGREYARQVPVGQLLLETDYPPQGELYVVDAMQEQLERTCAAIAQLRGVSVDELASCIAETSRRILSEPAISGVGN